MLKTKRKKEKQLSEEPKFITQWGREDESLSLTSKGTK